MKKLSDSSELDVAGMSANAVFGGMLLSGCRVAEMILNSDR